MAAPAPTRPPRLALAALTVAFVLAGAAFALGAPLFQAPDEPPHVDLVRHYARHPFDVPGPRLRVRSGVLQAVQLVGLPQGGPIRWPDDLRARPRYPRFDDFPGADRAAVGCHFGPFLTCQSYHYVHPPTFYVGMALPARVLERFSFPVEVVVLRLLCVLLVAPVVALTYYTALQVWPGARRRGLVAAALVAMFAPLAAVAGAVNNDSLMLLAAAATIAVAARLARRPTPGAALALGLATGAGLAVKIEFVALAAVSAIVVLAASVGRPRRDWLAFATRFTAPVVVGSAWWLRNLVHFHRLTPPGGEILQPARRGPWRSVGPVRYALDHGGDFLGRFWGLYGQTAVETPSAWRVGLGLSVVVLAALWLVARTWRRPSPAGVRLGLLALFPLVLVAGGLHASYTVYSRSGEVRGLLGRYLYAGVPVLAVGAVAALGAVAVRARRRLPLATTTAASAAGAAAGAAAVVVAAALGLAAFARAMHGFYGTRRLSLLLARADTVGAVDDLGRWLAVLGAAWLACVTVTVTVAARER